MDSSCQQRTRGGFHNRSVNYAGEPLLPAPLRRSNAPAGCGGIAWIRASLESRHLWRRSDTLRQDSLWRAGLCADALPGHGATHAYRVVGTLSAIGRWAPSGCTIGTTLALPLRTLFRLLAKPERFSVFYINAAPLCWSRLKVSNCIAVGQSSQFS